MCRRGGFLVLITSLVAGVCISVSAQTQAPPASIPDLAGIWLRPLLLFEPRDRRSHKSDFEPTGRGDREEESRHGGRRRGLPQSS